MSNKKQGRLRAVKVLIFAAIFMLLVLWIQNRLLPKARLTSALSKTVYDLKDRFRGDPLLLAMSLYHPEGKYSADVQVVTQQETTGRAEYDMTVHLDTAEHHMKTEGIIKVPTILLDVSAYLGMDYIAVSSDKLTDAQYYGITYESFTSDVRKIPLLGSLINERLISEWDTSLKKLRSLVEKEPAQIPDIKGLLLNVEGFLPGFMALPCGIEKEMIQRDGNAVSCHRIDYHFPRAQIERVWQGLDNIIGEKCRNLTISFFLHGDSLIRLSLAEDERESLRLDMGIDVINQPIQLRRMCSDGKVLTVTVDTRQVQGWFIETWEWVATKDGDMLPGASVSYSWHSESGDFRLQIPGFSEPVQCLLQETDSGVRLETKQLPELICALNGERPEKEGCTEMVSIITVGKGAQVVAPDYINLDAWSVDIFLTLLGGFGSLVGVTLY